MVRLFFDENFNGRMLDGLRRRLPQVELLRVQDLGMDGMPDQELLEWVANERYVLVSHDVTTMTRFAYDRIREGRYVSGVLLIADDMPIGQAINELMTIIEYSDAAEWENRVTHLPL
jgi:hypothetical protein